jgi:hypothetical protein
MYVCSCVHSCVHSVAKPQAYTIRLLLSTYYTLLLLLLLTHREDPSVVRNYGSLIIELAGAIPDGIVCFFTSYRFVICS